MTQVTDGLLEQMVQAILDEVDPEQVILFGSRSRGEEREDSDVEAEPFGKTRSRRLEAVRLWRVLSRFVVPKDILVYSRDETERWRGSIDHVLARALRKHPVSTAFANRRD